MYVSLLAPPISVSKPPPPLSVLRSSLPMSVKSLSPKMVPFSTYTLPDNVENGTIFGDRDFTLIGNELRNTLRGGGGFDTLIGGANNDTYILDGVTAFRIGELLGGDRYDAVQEDADGGIDTVQVQAVLRTGLPGVLGLFTTHYTLPDNVENGIVIGDRPFN